MTARRSGMSRWTGAAIAAAIAACNAPAELPAPAVPSDAWSRGVYWYGQKCAGCHGDDGQGDEERPALAPLARDPRPGSARTTPFATAADLHRYIRQNMPPLEAGSLDDDQAWAITVYVLQQAGIAVARDLPRERAGSVAIPGRK